MKAPVIARRPFGAFGADHRARVWFVDQNEPTGSRIIPLRDMILTRQITIEVLRSSPRSLVIGWTQTRCFHEPKRPNSLTYLTPRKILRGAKHILHQMVRRR